MKTKRRIQVIRRTFTYRRFQIIAALSVGLFLTKIFALPGPLEAQTTGTTTLTVHVTGARNAKGKIRVALFRDGKGFPNDASQAVHTQAADIDPQSLSAQVVFADLRVGVYAVSVFHDENVNERLDKNLMGMPKEGYGASNNPKRKMGPPNFDEAKFQLIGTEQSVEIKLKY
jgi:uncharacterized protein (DUF2141 family)